MDLKVILKTDRLTIREWTSSDIPAMAAINEDAEVMRYFPSVQSLAQTEAFVERQQQMQARRGYCYYAVTLQVSGNLIGFVGLSYQTYPTSFNPSVDIGWRLASEHWGKGLATEAAKAVLIYGHTRLAIAKIYAVAPAINIPSIHIMQKLGMQQQTSFLHPALADYPTLEKCICYKSTAASNF